MADCSTTSTTSATERPGSTTGARAIDISAAIHTALGSGEVNAPSTASAMVEVTASDTTKASDEASAAAEVTASGGAATR